MVDPVAKSLLGLYVAVLTAADARPEPLGCQLLQTCTLEAIYDPGFSTSY
jgi:hypothetical protein